jgi:hypothetical protein
MSEFTSPAFSQGREACKAGKRMTQNPYKHPPLKLAWDEGFAHRAQEEADAAKAAAKE